MVVAPSVAVIFCLVIARLMLERRRRSEAVSAVPMAAAMAIAAVSIPEISIQLLVQLALIMIEQGLLSHRSNDDSVQYVS